MERLTPEYLESQIVRTQFFRPEGCGTLTTCVLTMKNGLFITGESACLNPADFDAALGEKYARENAFSKLWQLEGYARACLETAQREYGYSFAKTPSELKQLCDSITTLPQGGWLVVPEDVVVEFKRKN